MIGGPYALLGPGSKDPFASYPGHNLPLPMLDALEHCESPTTLNFRATINTSGFEETLATWDRQRS